jgi:hypothetical protein
VDSCAESAASSTTVDMSDEPSDQSDTMQNPPVSKAAAQRQGRYVGKQSSLESVQSRIWSQHRHVCFSIDSSAHEAMLGRNCERRHCSATPRDARPPFLLLIHIRDKFACVQLCVPPRLRCGMIQSVRQLPHGAAAWSRSCIDNTESVSNSAPLERQRLTLSIKLSLCRPPTSLPSHVVLAGISCSQSVLSSPLRSKHDQFLVPISLWFALTTGCTHSQAPVIHRTSPLPS